MKRLIFSFCLLFICFEASTETKINHEKLSAQLIEKGILFFQRAEVQEVVFDILAYSEQAMDYLVISYEGNTLLEKSQGSVSSGFRSVNLMASEHLESPYAVVIWQKGVHGETIEVFKLGKGSTPLLSVNSSWPVKFSIDDDRLTYEAYGDRLEEPGDSEFPFEKISGTFPKE